MKKTIELLPKDIAESPIKIPKNPYWEVLKRFGTDEFIAMLINVIGTVIISFFTTAHIILSLAGPVVEKIGFFPMHFKEAWNIYKTTPKKQRRKFLYYFNKAIKGGLTSLTEDILIHDPIYILLMFLGLTIYPGVPIWLLAGASFIIAVFAVSGLEVLFREYQYWDFKRKMKKAGFKIETYYEARFFVSSKQDYKELLERFAKNFNLPIFKPLAYNDTYFEHDFPKFSRREPKIRFRKRTNSFKQAWLQTVQVIYTGIREEYPKKIEQYRFFPTKKEKIYYLLDQKMPKKIKDIKNLKVRRALKPVHDELPSKDIKFKRFIAHNKELLVSTDKIEGRKGFYLVELKVYKDVKLLMEAMRFLMKEFPVVQTTHGKVTF
jgi:hypothetical protein